MDVAALDLPVGVREVLASDGITALYPPQAEAVPAALAGKNLVLACPTASGKSLVGYLAIVRCVLEGGKALYIVPLRALAAEKYEDLRRFEPLGIKVGISTGDYDSPDVGLNRYDVVVLTSEKADSLLRHRSEVLHRVRCVVADEVHLIHDRDRGPTLEVTLARFLMENRDAQLIGLSATIANAAELAAWLGAVLVRSTWRPVPLRTGVFHHEDLYFSDGEVRPLTGPVRGGKASKTHDAAIRLTVDAVDGGGQCLIFASSRRSAEKMAEVVCAEIGSRLAAEERQALEEAGRRILRGEPTAMAETLARDVRQGVAFHHAGLTHAQRQVVEDMFRRRTLKVISATPTLAAGINLPARRVVVRDMKRYEAGIQSMEYLPVMEVQQMIGRAGRPRYDTAGEAVLVAGSMGEAEFLTEQYLRAEPEEIVSKLGVPAAFRVHVLSSVAGGYAHSTNDLLTFLKSTFFFASQRPRAPLRLVKECVRFLVREGFVTEDGERLAPSLFGRRTSELYLDPLSALVLRDALKAAHGGAAALSALGILQAICAAPDMDRVGGYLRRGEVEKMEEVLGRHSAEMLLPVPEDFEAREDFLRSLRNAVLLREWAEEVPVGTLTEGFDIGPGDLRARVETAKWLAYGMRELGRLFHAGGVGRVAETEARLRHGVRAELLDLVRLRGVGRVRARALFNSGYRDRAAVGGESVERLGLVPGIGPILARNLLEQLTGGQSVADPGVTEEDG